MTKEQIYDSKINPLMAQIISICKEHKIAMICNFAIPNEIDLDLVCTSALLDKEYRPTDEQLKALRMLRDSNNPPLMLTATHADGSKTLTAILG